MSWGGQPLLSTAGAFSPEMEGKFQKNRVSPPLLFAPSQQHMSTPSPWDHHGIVATAASHSVIQQTLTERLLCAWDCDAPLGYRCGDETCLQEARSLLEEARHHRPGRA